MLADEILAARSADEDWAGLITNVVPLLDFVTTRLTPSAAQQRHANAPGMDREPARQHLVRGHLKNIRGNLYWWSPHLRGDSFAPIVRQGAR